MQSSQDKPRSPLGLGWSWWRDGEGVAAVQPQGPSCRVSSQASPERFLGMLGSHDIHFLGSVAVQVAQAPAAPGHAGQQGRSSPDSPAPARAFSLQHERQRPARGCRLTARPVCSVFTGPGSESVAPSPEAAFSSTLRTWLGSAGQATLHTCDRGYDRPCPCMLSVCSHMRNGEPREGSEND